MPLSLLQHFIETRTLFSALTSAYPRIAKGLDYLPPSTFGNLCELGNLIFHCLPVRTDTDV